MVDTACTHLSIPVCGGQCDDPDNAIDSDWSMHLCRISRPQTARVRSLRLTPLNEIEWCTSLLVHIAASEWIHDVVAPGAVCGCCCYIAGSKMNSRSGKSRVSRSEASVACPAAFTMAAFFPYANQRAQRPSLHPMMPIEMWFTQVVAPAARDQQATDCAAPAWAEGILKEQEKIRK